MSLAQAADGLASPSQPLLLPHFDIFCLNFMINLHVTDSDGTQRSLAVKPSRGTSLMEVLTREQFDVAAICGGMASCGTCHVEVLKGGEVLDQPEDDEAFMLDSLPNLTDQSRLSCQIPVTKELDGMELKVMGDGA
jgi:2Fe-2S ferredoxin